tara:strand:+ start:3152 stop:4417 length:1266 start_codon:yes stop_codon:yes gene_type:complete
MKKSTQRYIDSEKSSNWLDSFLSNDNIEEKKPMPVIKEVVKDPVPKMDPVKDGDPIIDIDPDIEREISLIQEQRLGKKLVEVLPKDSEVIVETPNLGVSLVDFFASISEEKKNLKAKVKKDKIKIDELEKLFSNLKKDKKKDKKKLLLEPEEVKKVEENKEGSSFNTFNNSMDGFLHPSNAEKEVPLMQRVEKQISEMNTATEFDKEKIATLERIDSFDKMKAEFAKFKDTVSKQLSSLGGGGSVRISEMDDVDTSGQANGYALKYNSTTGSYDFGEVASDLSAVDQHIIPATNNTYDLGTSSKRWRKIYLASSTVDLGGATISSDGTGTIEIAATGATLPAGSKAGANEMAVVSTGASGASGQVARVVPFYSATGGLSSKNTDFEFNATIDNRTTFTGTKTFTLANGSSLADSDTTIFQF